MEIGYGSVSAYDSLRYTLYLDSTNTAFFTDAANKKYIIKLNNEHIQLINQHKKLWITLTQLSPGKIIENKITKFTNPTVEIFND